MPRRRCYGDSVFSVAGPCLWNRLPESIKALESFKSLLKTHLFEIAFQNLLYFLCIFRRKRFYCTAPLNGFDSKGAIVNILYYYYYYYY